MEQSLQDAFVMSRGVDAQLTTERASFERTQQQLRGELAQLQAQMQAAGAEAKAGVGAEAEARERLEAEIHGLKQAAVERDTQQAKAEAQRKKEQAKRIAGEAQEAKGAKEARGQVTPL